MKRPIKHSVAYIIPNEINKDKKRNEDHKHCLGINSLAYDEINDILYSGGRDGLSVGWKINSKVDNKDKSFSEPIFSSHHHSDWVNNMVLAHNGQSVFTASSDLTVKLWQPYKQTTENNVKTIGFHKDFVKCLSYVQSSEWLFSAGLDGKINIWDVNQSNISNENNNKTISSILSLSDPTAPTTSYYSLAVSQTGRLVSAGSPDGLIRLWDPRSDPNSGTIANFTGHTDNVRSLLISEDGKYILSGSSDCTIKLWSMASQRCVKTYTMHNEPVWSLFSADPNLKYFYAGSRQGLVTKTFISQDIIEDNKILNGQNNQYSLLDEYDNDDDSNTVAICQEQNGITGIIALKNHSYLWTSTTQSNISKWQDIEPNDLSKENQTNNNNDLVGQQLGLINITPLSENQFETINGNQNNLVDFDKQILPNTLLNGKNEDNLQIINQAILEDSSDEEELEANLIPIRNKPIEIIKGKPGLTKCLILSNRHQVLSLNSEREVMLWDIVKCNFIKSFGQVDIDELYNKINPMVSVPSWCTVDTKLGSLMVRLDENKCFDAEVYSDDFDGFKSEVCTETCDITSDTQINIGKWVIKSLFKAFCEKYSEEQAKIELEQSKSKKENELNNDNTNLGLINENLNKSNPVNSHLLNSPTCPQPVHTSTVKDDTPLSPFSVTLSSITNHQITPKSPTSTNPLRKMSTGSILSSSKTGLNNEGYFSINAPNKHPTPPTMIARSYTTNHIPQLSQNINTINDNNSDIPISTPISPGGTQIINPPPPVLTSSTSGFMGRLRQFSQKKLNKSPEPTKPLTLYTNEISLPSNLKHTNGLPNPITSPYKNKFTSPINSPTFEKSNLDPSSNSDSSDSSQNSNPPPPVPTQIETRISSEAPLPSSKEVNTSSIPNSKKGSNDNETTTPIIPLIELPTTINVLLSEESSDASRCIDIFSGSLATQNQDFNSLKTIMPDWVKNCVIKDLIPQKETVKIAFLLKPQESSGLSPLPSSSTRLLASRTLRMKKLVLYVWDKLDFTPDILHNLLINRQNQIKEINNNDLEDKNKSKVGLPSTLPPFIPENWIVLSCNGQIIPSTMTLATARYHVWKSSGDMTLTYDIQPLPANNEQVLTSTSLLSSSIASIEGEL